MFKYYCESNLDAFNAATNKQELLSKKQGLINDILRAHHLVPKSVLVVGFTPFAFCFPKAEVWAAEITDAGFASLVENGVTPRLVSLQDALSHGQKFDCVITSDEYFTFANDIAHQQALIHDMVDLCSGVIVTTLKDYKNLDFKEREFSLPAIVKGEKTIKFLEYHNSVNKNVWDTTVYEIVDETLKTFGPFRRCAMFFKQLAKFSTDAGATGFVIHKNLMNKSGIRKNYDHIISIKV